MLYNPEWKVKVDPLSKEALIAWLEKQDPNQRYEWYEPASCLLGLWTKSVDPTSCHDPESCTRYIVYGRNVDFWTFISEIACHNPHTFGAALERARKLV
jgi:hypothetical protein